MKKAQVGRIVGKAIKRFLKSPTKTTVARGTSEGIQRSKKPKAQYGIETNLNEFNQMGMKSGGNVKKKMKTGGMVNSNTKVSALEYAGSKGVKSGVNTKVSASKRATGKTGGTSVAPKGAVPKAKYGMVMRKK
jgi:hypothetical protein